MRALLLPRLTRQVEEEEGNNMRQGSHKGDMQRVFVKYRTCSELTWDNTVA